MAAEGVGVKAVGNGALELSEVVSVCLSVT